MFSPEERARIEATAAKQFRSCDLIKHWVEPTPEQDAKEWALIRRVVSDCVFLRSIHISPE